MIKKHFLLLFSLALISTGCAAASGPLGIGILSLVILSCAVFSGACNDNSGKSYRIFVTSAATDGNIGGVSGADTMCGSDIKNPDDGAVFKALISGINRSLTQDWVLRASTEYTRLDGTAIGSTDSDGRLTTPLENSFEQNGQYAWTGFSSTFSVNQFCADWQSNDSGYSGIYGYTGYITYGAWSMNTGNCDNEYAIICAEQ